MFNSAQEDGPQRAGCDTPSPAGVLFARGYCEGNRRSFQSLRQAMDCESMSTVRDERLCMHLVEDGLWFDVVWHSFTGGGSGGGFSYTRTLAGGDPCGVGATCSVDAGEVSCSCPEGTSGDPSAFCR